MLRARLGQRDEGRIARPRATFHALAKGCCALVSIHDLAIGTDDEDALIDRRRADDEVPRMEPSFVRPSAAVVEDGLELSIAEQLVSACGGVDHADTGVHGHDKPSVALQVEVSPRAVCLLTQELGLVEEVLELNPIATINPMGRRSVRVGAPAAGVASPSSGATGDRSRPDTSAAAKARLAVAPESAERREYRAGNGMGRILCKAVSATAI